MTPLPRYGTKSHFFLLLFYCSPKQLCGKLEQFWGKLEQFWDWLEQFLGLLEFFGDQWNIIGER